VTADAQGQAGGLERALQLSRELEGRVDAGDWPAAAALESERRELLQRFFATRPPAAELPRTIELLKQLIAANDALVGRAEHVQRGLARDAETIGIGRRAVLAYATHSA
jgi:translation initiation factor 2B subunit (eIF-2B alpha/beta/delta family)